MESRKQHGPWQIKASAIRYQDRWLTVRRDEVICPDGSDGSYAVATLRPGVCVIALDDQDNVHLTREFHYGVGRVTIEGVSGGIEDGHTATETAHRELQEELGLQAQQLISLGVTDPFTAGVVSPTALFVATGITAGVATPEPTELIEPVVMPLAAAIDAVRDGTITHAPTCIILLRLAMERLSRGQNEDSVC